jgi:hypothetical protein
MSTGEVPNWCSVLSTAIFLKNIEKYYGITILLDGVLFKGG